MLQALPQFVVFHTCPPSAAAYPTRGLTKTRSWMMVPGNVASSFHELAGGAEESTSDCALGSRATIGRLAEIPRAPVSIGTVRLACGTCSGDSWAAADMSHATVSR